MKESALVTYPQNDEALWNKVKKAFTDTYMDIAEGVKVNKDLQELYMKDGDICHVS